MKNIILVLATVCLLASLIQIAWADERINCVITMVTDGGTVSTAEQIADGGCTLLADGGIDSCTALPDCDWGTARSLSLQCDNPVYYTAVPNGRTNSLNQKTTNTVTTSDILVDFDINPDPYRIDLRNQSQHLSLKSVSTSANTCKVGTVYRLEP